MADIKIISGGQTGVDRAALDAALAKGIPCGGFCPAGRRAEDGPIPTRYPLRELVSKQYSHRTLRNVKESDGTLVVYREELSGGTALAVRCCFSRRRPFLLIDAREVSAARAAERTQEFIERHGIKTLNVAGPRASQWSGGYDYAIQLMTELFSA